MKENLYLKRYAYPSSHFELEPLAAADMLVVIPCFDEPDLINTLDSLNQANVPESCHVGVLIVINHGQGANDDITKRNGATLAQFNSWVHEINTSSISFQCALVELPQKHAGVGLARKIGMDDTVRVFDLSSKEGVIVCLDADCTVDSNYFEALWDTFSDNRVSSASLHFEHEIDPLRKDEDPEGIALYEIYLRYYIDALRYAGYPHAVQTIGSSMAVRSSAYQKCGGMNRRKAGEDFYFIHKLLPLGGYVEINTTAVRPSGRISTRVPFGTGAAIGKWTEDPSTLDELYHPSIFEDLKHLVENVDKLFNLSGVEISAFIDDLPASIRGFLKIENGVQSILDIKAKTTTLSSFKKQFWSYFDGLKMLKYVHYSSEHFSPKITINDGLSWLFNSYVKREKPKTLATSLIALREFDRANKGQTDL